MAKHKTDLALTALQAIPFEVMHKKKKLKQAQDAAKEWMNKTWDFSGKITEYERKIDNMSSVRKIEAFCWNTTLSGLRVKRYA